MRPTTGDAKPILQQADDSSVVQCIKRLPGSLTEPKLLFCHHRNSAIIHFEPSAISSNLDTKYKYETGIFMSSFDNEGFFDSKVICDSLRVSVKTPDFRDKLIILVIGVSSTPTHDFNIMGIGYNAHFLVGNVRINFK